MGDYYDTFCVYCQKHYTTMGRFARHVSNEHPGVWANLIEREPYIEYAEKYPPQWKDED